MAGFDYTESYKGNTWDGNPNIERKHWFSERDAGQDTLFIGYIDLEILRQRPSEEKYLVVIYNEGDELPKGYVPLPESARDSKLVAAYLNNANLQRVYHEDGALQLIHCVDPRNIADGMNVFELGFGPEKIDLRKKAANVIEAYNAKIIAAETDLTNRMN